MNIDKLNALIFSRKLLYEVMGKRLAHAMHEFNHSNHPRQLFWNGYHHAIIELQADLAKLIEDAEFSKVEQRWLDGEEDE